MHQTDSHSLPTIDGVLDRCLINPRGDIDSLLLADGTEVRLPPRDEEHCALLRPAAILAAYGPGFRVDGS